MNLPKLTIRGDKPVPLWTILLDGEPVRATALRLNMAFDRLPELTLELPAGAVEVDLPVSLLELRQLRTELDDAKAIAADLLAEVRRLRAALEPFAATDEEMAQPAGEADDFTLQYGYFQRARAALEGKQPQTYTYATLTITGGPVCPRCGERLQP